MLIDGFCGVGGNAVHFARSCRKVLAIDIDPEKIRMARHNAAIYGVLDRIEFVVGDFMQLAPSLKVLLLLLVLVVVVVVVLPLISLLQLLHYNIIHRLD